MANHSLDDHLPAINLSLESYNHLNELASRSCALVHVASCDHFFDSNKEVIHDYLWTLQSLLDDIKETLRKIPAR
jgi:hypothetical protein